jgi:hypothetical protein
MMARESDRKEPTLSSCRTSSKPRVEEDEELKRWIE